MNPLRRMKPPRRPLRPRPDHRRRRPALPVTAAFTALAALALAVAAATHATAGSPTAGPGFAASLGLTGEQLTTFSGPAPGDLGPPQLTAVDLYDVDVDGRVDRVVTTFSKTLATPYTAGTTGWTLADAPSGATLASVAVSGSSATLTLNEGAGAPATDVAGFTVALAATAGGIRDSADRLSSFSAASPTDRAAPVPVGVVTSVGGSRSGQMQADDQLTFSFSEPLSAASIPSSSNVTEADTPGSSQVDTIDIPGVTDGSLDTGGTGYITKNGGSSTAAATISGAPDSRSFTVTLGSCSCGDAKAGQGAISYVPAAGLTDATGNAAAGSFTTAAGFRIF